MNAPNLSTESLSTMKDEASEKEPEIVVHERQSLQLCGLHAVNALLQLSSETRELPWRCGSVVLPRSKEELMEATKSEFDSIADELTLAELRLLSAEIQTDHAEVVEEEEEEQSNEGERSSSLTCGGKAAKGPSTYHKLTSSHRTMIFGNYSFEVMQIALQRRGVELSWFSPKTTESLLTADEGELVIGFIVNSLIEDDDWWSTGMLKRLPIVNWFFDTSRHWYAITRVRRSEVVSRDDGEFEWKVLDSDKDEQTCLSNDELFDYLQHVLQDESAVFRATIKLAKTENHQ